VSSWQRWGHLYSLWCSLLSPSGISLSQALKRIRRSFHPSSFSTPPSFVLGPYSFISSLVLGDLLLLRTPGHLSTASGGHSAGPQSLMHRTVQTLTHLCWGNSLKNQFLNSKKCVMKIKFCIITNKMWKIEFRKRLKLSVCRRALLL